MGLQITRLQPEAPNPRVKVNGRLWRTSDGRRLVADGHPDAAILFCAAGDEVDAADFESYQLDAEIELEPAEGQKAKPPLEDKALKAPPEDKGAESVVEADPESEISGTVEETAAPKRIIEPKPMRERRRARR